MTNASVAAVVPLRRGFFAEGWGFVNGALHRGSLRACARLHRHLHRVLNG